MLFLIGSVGPLLTAQDSSSEQPFSEFRALDFDEPPAPFQKVLSQFQSVDVFRAKFVETRHIKALRKPLKNRGYVLFSRKHGLLRRIEKPMQSDQLISKKGVIVERTPDRTRRRKLESGTPPRKFIDSLFYIFSGEFEKFDRNFDVFIKIDESPEDRGRAEKEDEEKEKNGGKDNQSAPEQGKSAVKWTLGLKPGTDQIKKLLDRIVIEGRGKHLVTLNIFKNNGDRFFSSFENHSYPDRLTEDQKKTFRSLLETSDSR